jgi:hypothetical protein
MTINDEDFEQNNSSNEASFEGNPNEPTMLQVVIRLVDRDEVINVCKGEDTLRLSKEFCKKNNLAGYLIKRINAKIKQAIKSLDLILEHPDDTKEENS